MKLSSNMISRKSEVPAKALSPKSQRKVLVQEKTELQLKKLLHDKQKKMVKSGSKDVLMSQKVSTKSGYNIKSPGDKKLL